MGNLYEFEKEAEGGGPQSIGAEPVNLEFGLTVLPSIMSRNALIRYIIPAKQHITLTLYDVAGCKIGVLTDGMVGAGIYSYHYNSSAFGAGIYFLILKSEREIVNQKGDHSEIKENKEAKRHYYFFS